MAARKERLMAELKVRRMVDLMVWMKAVTTELMVSKMVVMKAVRKVDLMALTMD
jgi:hypothetical protein